jgi:hypothetical protein
MSTMRSRVFVIVFALGLTAVCGGVAFLTLKFRDSENVGSSIPFALHPEAAATEFAAGRRLDVTTPPVAGRCGTAEFVFVSGSPKARDVFHDGDTLAIKISYAAGPACTRVQGVIFGYFTPHTPWFDYYTRGGSAGMFNGNIPTNEVRLTAPRGVVMLVAQPGPFPPPDLASPPNLEGFVFCGAVLTFDDGTDDGSGAFEQLDTGCGGPSYVGPRLPESDLNVPLFETPTP